MHEEEAAWTAGWAAERDVLGRTSAPTLGGALDTETLRPDPVCVSERDLASIRDEIVRERAAAAEVRL